MKSSNSKQPIPTKHDNVVYDMELCSNTELDQFAPGVEPPKLKDDAQAIAYVISKLDGEVKNIQPLVDEDVYKVTDKEYRKIEREALRFARLPYDNDTAVNSLMVNNNIDRDSAKAHMKAAREKVRKEYKRYVTEVAEQNVNTLRQMLLDCLEVNDRKTALGIIQELNKMCALYTNNVFIQNNTINNGSTDEPITIVFG